MAIKRHGFVERGAVVLLSLLSLAAMVLPLCQQQLCVVPTGLNLLPEVSAQGFVLGRYRQQAAAQFATFFGAIFAGTIMCAVLVLRRRRADRAKKVQLWVWVFVCFFSTHAMTAACFPWLFVACPSSSHFTSMYFLLQVIFYLSRLISSFALAKISLVHLATTELHRANRRGSWTLRAMIFCALMSILMRVAHMEVGATVFMIVSVVCFLSFHINQLLAFNVSVRRARMEALREGKDDGAVREAATIAGLSLVDSVSSVATVVSIFGITVEMTHLSQVLYQLSLLTKHIADVGLALFCGGFLCLKKDSSQALQVVPGLLEARRRRQLLGALREAAKNVSGSAGALAALFEGVDEETLLDEAVARFRCVSWEVLAQHPYLVIGAGPLDGSVADNDFYKLSSPCKLAQCDAFWSHSWHDDGELKWAALSTWCEDFRQEHGRPPMLWFDKVCINQIDIQKDLQCLPIFLAGCNTLLITCGPTYTARLWCCTELFVYMSIKFDDDTRTNPMVLVLGETQQAQQSVLDTWRGFDITGCECCMQEDKDRILSVVEQNVGGAQGFNIVIRQFAKALEQPGTIVRDGSSASWLQLRYAGGPERTLSSISSGFQQLSEPSCMVVSTGPIAITATSGQTEPAMFSSGPTDATSTFGQTEPVTWRIIVM